LAGSRHASGSLKRRLALIGAALALIGGGLGAFLALSGGSGESSGGGSSPSASPSAEPVPHFSFALASVRALPTGSKQGVLKAAHAAAQRIHLTLDQLYVTGFIDPGAWRTGHYFRAWQTFTSDAVGTARRDESTLTLGTGAGRMFRAVRPHAGAMKVRILMDPSGHPSTAVADISFSAQGTMPNGRTDVIRSDGHYFLRPSPRGWSIYAYEVRRNDSPAPVPSKTPSPSIGGSP
jgi:hypothetical protein